MITVIYINVGVIEKYRVIKILKRSSKVIERVLTSNRKLANTVIFIVRQVKEELTAKNRTFFYVFVDLENARTQYSHGSG